MSASVTTPACNLDSQLIAFLSGMPGAREKFTVAARGRLRRMAAKLTVGWSADLREEVVQHVFLALLENPSRFDPARGNAVSFLFQLTREAVRGILAAYAPPGAPKRFRGTRAPAPVALDDLTEADWQRANLSHYGTAAAVEARCEVIGLARNMPSPLQFAFARIADNEPKTAIASEVGVNRFKLDRQIARFVSEIRSAA